MAYLHSESITLDHTKCGSGNSTNFPFLFSSTIANLKTVGNGGEVTNANGYDIIFSSAANDFTGASKLDFEIESYNASTGQFIAHVRIPTVSSSVDTVIYLVWGNALISTSQENITGVWDSHYKAVYHLKDGSTLSLLDSTGNSASLTNSGSATATTGTIDGGANFDGASQYMNRTSSVITTAPFTMEAWMYPINANAGVPLSALDQNSINWNGFYFGFGTGVISMVTVSNNFASFDSSGNVSISVNNWHYVVGVSSSSSSRYVYVDNNKSTQGTANITPGTSPSGIGLGASVRANHDNFYNGKLDEVRFSDIVRNDDWLTTQYNNQSNPGTFYTLGSEVGSGRLARATILNGLSPAGQLNFNPSLS